MKTAQGFRLPGVGWLAAGTVVAIAIGQVTPARQASPLFWLCFPLAAALPPLAALAVAGRRLGYAATWNRVMGGILAGGLLSTSLTIVLGGMVSLVAYLLILPLREVVARAIGSTSLEALFYSPTLMLLMVELAFVAPVMEELTKPVAAVVLARRLRGPAEAFLVGMAGGVGFAFVENMLYEAAGLQVWAAVASLRAIGGVLHPLNAGLVAVGWYGVRHGLPGAWGRLLGLYGLAVGTHALWNGGLVVLFSGIGAYFFGTEAWRFNIYGLGQPGIVVVFMIVEAIALWRLLVVVAGRLRDPEEPEIDTALALHLERPRRLALWATGLVLVLVPVGALYGPLVARYVDKLLPVG
jgi:RsiW-degrading membrane proteinase PrsW (M82 family)